MKESVLYIFIAFIFLFSSCQSFSYSQDATSLGYTENCDAEQKYNQAVETNAISTEINENLVYTSYIPIVTDAVVHSEKTTVTTALEVECESIIDLDSAFKDIDYASLLQFYLDRAKVSTYTYMDADNDNQKELIISAANNKTNLNLYPTIVFDSYNQKYFSYSYGKEINESARGGVTLGVEAPKTPVLIVENPVQGVEVLYYKWDGRKWVCFAEHSEELDWQTGEFLNPKYILNGKEVFENDFPEFSYLEVNTNTLFPVTIATNAPQDLIDQYTKHLEDTFLENVFSIKGDFDLDGKDEYAWVIGCLAEKWGCVSAEEAFYPKGSVIIYANYENEMLSFVAVAEPYEEYISVTTVYNGVELYLQGGSRVFLKFEKYTHDGFPYFEKVNLPLEVSKPCQASESSKSSEIPEVSVIPEETHSQDYSSKKKNVYEYIGMNVGELIETFGHDYTWYFGNGQCLQFEGSEIEFYTDHSYDDKDKGPYAHDKVISITCSPYTYLYGDGGDKHRVTLKEFAKETGLSFSVEEDLLDGGLASYAEEHGNGLHLGIVEENGELFVQSLLLKRIDA